MYIVWPIYIYIHTYIYTYVHIHIYIYTPSQLGKLGEPSSKFSLWGSAPPVRSKVFKVQR